VATACPREDGARAAFGREFNVRPLRFSGSGLNRAIREAVGSGHQAAAVRAVLGQLGFTHRPWEARAAGVLSWPEFWGASETPRLIVAHPPVLSTQDRRRLELLSRFSPRVRVFVDDRPGYGDPDAHHVRVELETARRPPKGGRLEALALPPAAAR
jgi:hypothetical protein